jgi:hypothetical protein
MNIGAKSQKKFRGSPLTEFHCQIKSRLSLSVVPMHVTSGFEQTVQCPSHTFIRLRCMVVDD